MDDLVGWWQMNGNPNDDSGNGLDLTVTGTTLDTNRFGDTNSSYNFTPTAYLRRTGETLFDIKGDLTICAWVRVDGATNQTIISNNRVTGFALWATLTGFQFRHVNQGKEVIARTHPNTNWVHVAVTYDSASKMATSYLNGVFQSTSSIYTNDPVVDDVTSIGVGADGAGLNFPFNGSIDQVGLWRRELDVDEILVVYNFPIPYNP